VRFDLIPRGDWVEKATIFFAFSTQLQ
jgi:hypothetical protein